MRLWSTQLKQGNMRRQTFHFQELFSAKLHIAVVSLVSESIFFPRQVYTGFHLCFLDFTSHQTQSQKEHRLFIKMDDRAPPPCAVGSMFQPVIWRRLGLWPIAGKSRCLRGVMSSIFIYSPCIRGLLLSSVRSMPSYWSSYCSFAQESIVTTTKCSSLFWCRQNSEEL